MKFVYLILFLIISCQSYAQDSIKFEPRVNLNSINKLDSSGQKQGYWIVFGVDKPEKGYPDSLRIEEGSYLNDRKNGVWIKYHINGITPKLIGKSKNGRPFGNYSKYYSNGVLKEVGHYENGKHKGLFIKHYSSGCIRKFGNYNDEGKENGVITLYYDNDSTTNFECNHIEFQYCANNGKRDSTYYFNKDGEIHKFGFQITCYGPSNKNLKTSGIDTNQTNIMEHPFTNVTPIDNKVYNNDNELWMKGTFKNGYLWNGKFYKYDQDGILLKIEIWKEGKYCCDGQL